MTPFPEQLTVSRSRQASLSFLMWLDHPALGQWPCVRPWSASARRRPGKGQASPQPLALAEQLGLYRNENVDLSAQAGGRTCCTSQQSGKLSFFPWPAPDT
jgi:hypothetical protein